MKQDPKSSPFGFGSTAFRLCPRRLIPGAKNLSLLLVAQASACVHFNAAAMYPLAENPTVEILSSWRTKA
jgi:hypothetical protein